MMKVSDGNRANAVTATFLCRQNSDISFSPDKLYLIISVARFFLLLQNISIVELT